jgi:thiol-disulfide isomerase/thioredoxin
MKNKLPIILASSQPSPPAPPASTARQQAATAQRPAATPAQHAALDSCWAWSSPTAAARQPLAQWKGKVLVLNFWATWCPRAGRRSRPFRR